MLSIGHMGTEYPYGNEDSDYERWVSGSSRQKKEFYGKKGQVTQLYPRFYLFD